MIYMTIVPDIDPVTAGTDQIAQWNDYIAQVLRLQVEFPEIFRPPSVTTYSVTQDYGPSSRVIGLDDLPTVSAPVGRHSKES